MWVDIEFIWATSHWSSKNIEISEVNLHSSYCSYPIYDRHHSHIPIQSLLDVWVFDYSNTNRSINIRMHALNKYLLIILSYISTVYDGSGSMRLHIFRVVLEKVVSDKLNRILRSLLRHLSEGLEHNWDHRLIKVCSDLKSVVLLGLG